MKKCTINQRLRSLKEGKKRRRATNTPTSNDVTDSNRSLRLRVDKRIRTFN